MLGILIDQACAALGVRAGHRRNRADDDADLAGIGNAEHADAEPSAQVAVARVGFPAAALGRYARRDPHLVGDRRPVHRLEDQFEVEGQLQFADHHDGRLALAQAQHVAAADLALDGVAGAFEKGFDGKVERGFHAGPTDRSPRRIA